MLFSCVIINAFVAVVRIGFIANAVISVGARLASSVALEEGSNNAVIACAFRSTCEVCATCNGFRSHFSTFIALVLHSIFAVSLSHVTLRADTGRVADEAICRAFHALVGLFCEDGRSRSDASAAFRPVASLFVAVFFHQTFAAQIAGATKVFVVSEAAV